MRNILLTISYQGTHFHGYQVQPNLRTVEGEIISALKKVVGEEVKLLSAGRTDAGVHALGQRANFKTDLTIDVGNFPKVINYHLPEDVTIVKAEEVEPDFHARFSAKKKHYRYVIWNTKNPYGALADHVTFVAEPLDFDRMERAILTMEGEHDFSAFIGKHSAKDVNPIRTIDKITCQRRGEFFIVDFYAMSFLKNHIRIIMGTAIEIGKGYREEGNLLLATETRNRSDLGHTADPSGLYLMEIQYT